MAFSLSVNEPVTISVVIPNYNGKHLLERNLPFVCEALNNTKIDFEIIIVDDFSTDNSAIFITQNYPTVILIINEKNHGFSFSCNKGIAIAKAITNE